MKALVCEMCNSSEIVKQDGFFVCQCCGMKYAPEEAKKMMIDGPVTVTGTVSIDNSGSYDRIISLARDAFADGSYDKSYDYYCQAVEIKPDEAENVLRQSLSLLGKDAVQTGMPSSCEKRAARALELLKNISDGEYKERLSSMFLEDIGVVCDYISSQLKKILYKLSDEYEVGRSSADKAADLGRHVIVAALNEAEDRRISRHNDALHNEFTKIRERISEIENFRKVYSEKLVSLMGVDHLITTGLGYIQNDVYESAVTCFEKYIKAKPESIVGYIGKAAALLGAEKYDSAAEEVENASDFVPADSEKDYLHTLINMKLSKNQSTLLINAAAVSNFKAVKLLVELGADVNAKTKDQITALWWVAKGKRFDEQKTIADRKIAELLLDNGASIDVTAESGTYKGANLYNKYTDSTIKALIRAKHPDAVMKNNPNSGGCYVATAVYGSYDCPQVWTLRRYRDNILSANFFGRMFIRTYYAISPTLVKWFGNTNWFKKLWQKHLDRMVSKLQNSGVEATPYEDQNW